MAAAAETASIAPSETPTLVEYSTSSSSKEKQTETVNVKLSLLLTPEELINYNTKRTAGAKKARIDRFLTRIKSNEPKEPEGIAADGVKKVKMTPSEYRAYWAKDADGNYIGTEPQEVGRAIWRRKLWAELYLPPPQPSNDVSGRTGANARAADYPSSWSSQGGGWANF